MSIARAERLANQLWTQLGKNLPVDVFQVARFLNVAVLEQEMEDAVSGMLVIEGDVGIVAVNTSHHIHRKRFTLAHEIGHFLLHRSASTVFVDGSPVFYRDSVSAEGVRTEEIAANAFAAELLMPKQAMRDAVGQHGVDVFDEAEIWRLAECFAVSTQAMTIRLTRLGLLSA